jgi:hypothetical protein
MPGKGYIRLVVYVPAVSQLLETIAIDEIGFRNLLKLVRRGWDPGPTFALLSSAFLDPTILFIRYGTQ